MVPEKYVHFMAYDWPEKYRYSNNSSRNWDEVTCPVCLEGRPTDLVPVDAATSEVTSGVLGQQ